MAADGAAKSIAVTAGRPVVWSVAVEAMKAVGLAPPNAAVYSSKELTFVAIDGPFSVYPKKAGMAVDTSATDGGRVDTSST